MTTPENSIRIIGRELKSADFSQMSWPLPSREVAWQIRYLDMPPITTMMHAASVLDA